MVSEVELSEPPGAGGYSISLPSFEGPLDLLLHLCQKHELNILDIPIGFVTEKYLEYLAVMQLINLDVASEYLVMAATLAHIKSKMLLPAPPPGQEDDAQGEEEEDPRESLIRRLLEYQKYKQAGDELSARGVAGRDVFGRGMALEEAIQTGIPPLARVPLFSLVEAFQAVLSKSQVKLSHDIVHERVTLTDRINELVDLLRGKKRVSFEDIFEGQVTRFDLVITFLALLEMTKLRMTRLFQDEPMGPIYIEFVAMVGAEDGTADPTRDAPPEGTAGEERKGRDTDASPPLGEGNETSGEAEGSGAEDTSPTTGATDAPPPGEVREDLSDPMMDTIPPAPEPLAHDDETSHHPTTTIPSPPLPDDEGSSGDPT